MLAVSTLALNEVWYKQYKSGSFHLFNDWREWKQMDKAGHVFTSYQLGRAGIGLMKWSGANDRKSALLGGGLGFFYLASIEVLDGFSKGWGFSFTDVAANTVGSAMVTGQHLAWKEQRLILKYSFSRSSYYEYRPSLLGSSRGENLVKDYNGQTYWLSVSPKSFFPSLSVPSWLCMSFGYGADGMISAEESFNHPLIDRVYFKRYRQYYLSLDLDLSKIKAKSHFLNAVLHTFNFIKVPFPSIEYNSFKGLRGHAFGF